MKKKIKISDLVKLCADLAVETSIVNDKNAKLYKKIEEIGGFKLEGGLKTELLAAEIFVCQIPLNIFLSIHGKTDLLELYYSTIYYLLVNKYKYFKYEKELELFEVLMQADFKDYYKVLSGETKEPILSLGRKIAEKLATKKEKIPLLSLTFFALMDNKMNAIDQFIKESSKKFDIETDS